ncbi:hypothetical protein E8E13_010357 [Curvularia kusanoi]|uniref:N-alpha-acetyltransferase 40 n=1 Tax=Curvularia kusanoi TaxID=90978 RepID=A0A9P4W8T5_CURKU|nr:hypothetical protein E8E13_010357 [Curvularia kusanoi]
MDTDNARLRSAADDFKNVSLPTESINADTPLEQRTIAIERAHNPPGGQSKSAFQQFSDLPLFSTVRFELKRSNWMTSDELTACRNLISSTSQKNYEASCIGWNPEDKKEEMSHADMMYLLVRQAQKYIDSDNEDSQKPSTASLAGCPGAILGFLSFKLEPEDEENEMFRPVAYIYEVHLDKQLRNQGLGARLIQWVEDQARMASISKMMLTVFAVNKGARRMYERQGFVRDPLSPEDKVTRRRVIEPDYIIMSKEI